MMKYIIFLLLIILIGLICALVKMLKSNKETNTLNSSDNNYTLLRVISFLFPIVGLIIYAVNIGKNDYLAKEGSKWAIIGMISGVIVIILCFIIATILIPQSTTISGTAISSTRY